MPSVAAADRTGPNLEVSTTVVGGEVPCAIVPALGEVQLAGFIQQGAGGGKRITYQFPENLPSFQGIWYRFLAFMPYPSESLVVLQPCRTSYVPGLLNYHYDWGNRTESTWTVGNVDDLNLVQGKRYVYELTFPDANNLKTTLWEDCGGDPIGEWTLNTLGIGAVPALIYVGWPNADVNQSVVPRIIPDYEAYLSNAGQDPLAHYRSPRPYMIKVLSVTPDNVGPSSAAFYQETALTQAADLPAGTYVGRLSIEHGLGIKSHVYSDMGVPFDNEYEIKDNKLYTKVRSSALTVMDAGLDVIVRDIFNKELGVTCGGENLVVTA